MSATSSIATKSLLPGTVLQILQDRVTHQGEDCVYTFLCGNEQVALTYSELDALSRATAAALLQHCVPGDRALLIYPPGLEYIVALYACMYAGVIAVPSHAPRPNRPLSRLQSIVANAKPAAVLTTRELLDSPRSIFGYEQTPVAKLPRIATDKIDENAVGDLPLGEISPETPVILQYTSGSTALPKGVTLTHGNIVHNTAAIQRNFPLSPEDATVFWLPPFHDMGLIGGILQPLCTGFPVRLMSPVSFLQRPARWLQAISQFRATCSGAPNFAYDLCVRRIGDDELEGLDLSSWKIAFNGAEPIRKKTLDEFCEKFARCGFRRSAFHPCYGLAESTLMVTGMDRDGVGLKFESVSRAGLEKDRIEPPRSGSDETALVSCGSAQGNQDVRIVNPNTAEPLPDDSVGEIWVSGQSVAAGYWNLPQETEAIFRARLVSGEGPFLRTGDLGFLRDGQLYITGRIKDLIIIRGQNFYPHDIEFDAQRSHAALQPSTGAAFSLQQDGIERLILVQEVEARLSSEELQQISEKISAAIAQAHDLRIDDVVFVKAWTIPRTTSGKMQRYLCRSAYISGTLQRLSSA